MSNQTSDNNKIASNLKRQNIRFNDISILRVIAMLMVVFYHCLCPYSIWDHTDYFIGFHVPIWDVVNGILYQIHLPIFFIISGYLYGYKRILGGYKVTHDFVINKSERVLFPYIIVGAFLCVLQHREIGQMLNGISHLWFLLVIFECYLLGRFFENVLWFKNKPQRLLIILAVLFIIGLSYRIPTVKFLALWGLFRYFPFYLIGMLMCNIDFEKLAKYKTAIFCGIIGMVLCLVFQQLFMKRVLLSYLFGVVVVLLSFSYARIIHIKTLPQSLISLDKCSMGIYIVHHIVIQEMNVCRPFRELAIEYKYGYPVVQFFLVTLACWFLVSLCHNSKYSKYVLG